jgi:hypothetical protein
MDKEREEVIGLLRRQDSSAILYRMLTSPTPDELSRLEAFRKVHNLLLRQVTPWSPEKIETLLKSLNVGYEIALISEDIARYDHHNA